MSTRILILRLIADDAMACYQIADALGMLRTTVHNSLKRMRAKKLIHVEYWWRTASGPLPMWIAGNGKDAKKPEPIPQHVCSRNWRHKKKVPLTDPVMAALLGYRKANAKYFTKKPIKQRARPL